MIENTQEAFEIFARELGIAPLLGASDLHKVGGPDPLALISYLSRLYTKLKDIMPEGVVEPSIKVLKSPNMKRRRMSAVGLLHGQSNRKTGLLAIPEKTDGVNSEDVLFESMNVNHRLMETEDVCHRSADELCFELDRGDAVDTAVVEPHNAVTFKSKPARRKSQLYEGLDLAMLRSKLRTDNKDTFPSVIGTPPRDEFIPRTKRRTNRRPVSCLIQSFNESILGAPPEPTCESSARKRTVSESSSQSTASSDPVEIRRKNKSNICPGISTPERKSVLDRVREFNNTDSQSCSNSDEEGPVSNSSDVCCACGRHLGVAESHTGHGVFFHRHCFHCTVCLTRLHLGTSRMHLLHTGKVQFYCMLHARLCLKETESDDRTWDVPYVYAPTEDDSDKRDKSSKNISDKNLNNFNTLDPGYDDIMDTRNTLNSIDDDDFDSMVAHNHSFLVGQDDLLEDENEDEMEDIVDGDDISSMQGTTPTESLTHLHEIYFQNLLPEINLKESDSDKASLSSHTNTDDEDDTGPLSRRYTCRRGGEGEDSIRENSRSIRLMLAFEVQREMEELEEEQKDLEEQGMVLEEQIRSTDQDDPAHEDLVEQWMELLDKKQELSEQESKLVIQARIIQLQAQSEQQENDKDDIDHVDNTQCEYSSKIDVYSLKHQMEQLSSYLDVLVLQDVPMSGPQTDEQ